MNAASLAGQTFRGDRVVGAFGTLWLQRGASPPAPAKQAWVVYGADSTSKYLLGFRAECRRAAPARCSQRGSCSRRVTASRRAHGWDRLRATTDNAILAA